MKILTLAYYGTFSRYFRYLEKNICEINPKVSFFNVSIYPSAHLFWKENNEHSVFLPHEIRKIEVTDITEIGETYNNISIVNVMRYHLQLLKIKQNTPEYNYLKLNAIRYIEYFDNLFKTHKFDIFICSGDSRLFVEIAVIIAKKYNVKICFFEQGPYNTTIIDEQGVNANSSFRTSFLKDQKCNDDGSVEKFINRKKSPKFYKDNYKYYIYKILDLIYLSPPIKNIFPIDLITESNFTNLFIRNIKRTIFKKSKTDQTIEIPEKSILLILQVPYDVQMIYNSPLFSNFSEMVEIVHKSIPVGWNLIIREHPLFINSYDKDMYSYIKNNDILIINNMPLDEMIRKSEVVVVNNSTVGLEVLVHYKPLVILGDCYYDNHGVGYKVNSIDEIKIKIEEAIRSAVPRDKIDIFLYNLFFEYLFEGHFQDKNLKSGRKIAQFILSRFYGQA